MKKFLVPTDFSDTSKNAARYAVELAQDDPETTIILYNLYEKLAPGSDGSLLTETDEDRKKVLTQALANLEIELHSDHGHHRRHPARTDIHGKQCTQYGQAGCLPHHYRSAEGRIQKNKKCAAGQRL